MRRLLVTAAIIAACSNSLPPYGQVVLYVDTDAAVPQLVGQLRVEVLRASDLSVIDARDVSSRDPQAWPVSFGIYDPSANVTRDALVRLRAFPEGRLDATTGEPQVGVTIDRLVSVHLVPGVATRARVTLFGECFGTPADLSTRTSCSRTKLPQLEPATPLTDEDPSGPTLAGTFGASQPCTATPRGAATASDGTSLFQEEVCLPGGAFLFGNQTEYAQGDSSGLPERVVVVSPMRMDKYEVTVGRWRAAIRSGFSAPVQVNEAALSATALYACTFSNTRTDREKYPLNCLPFTSARAFCRWAGGDLPSEVQWEYAAQVSGRDFKTSFPWGDAPPDCDRAVFDRAQPPLSSSCVGPAPAGPAPEDASPNDASVGFEIKNLGGELSEYLLDAHASLTSSCWADAPLHDPVCSDEARPKSLRGGAWVLNAQAVVSSNRQGVGAPPIALGTRVGPGIGFRCVRAGVE